MVRLPNGSSPGTVGLRSGSGHTPSSRCHCDRGEPGGVEVVAGLGQPVTALDYPHPHCCARSASARASSARRCCSRRCFCKSLGLGRVALHLSPPRFTLFGVRVSPVGCGQSFLDRRDRRPQPDDVAVLGIAGEPILVVVRGDNRIRPPGTGLGSQRRPYGCSADRACELAARASVSRPAGSGWRPTHRSQVLAPQPRPDARPPRRARDSSSSRGPQPGANRHPGRPRHRLHPTPLPQFFRRHNPTIPDTTDTTGHYQHQPTNTPTAKNP